MILQNTCIIVAHCDLVIHVDEECIINARMLEVMHGCWNKTAHLLKIIQFEYFFHSSVYSEVVESLANVRCMSLIVVGDILIASLEGSHKVH